MLHYYIQKGFKPEYILSLDVISSLFFKASMDKALEEMGEILNAVFGAKGAT